MEANTSKPPPEHYSHHPTTTSTKPVIIFILGSPGAGKGTLCKILSPKIKAYHLSVGDYLRELCNYPNPSANPAARGGWTQEQLIEAMTKRDLVPASTIVSILKHKLNALRVHGWGRVVLDGFPRTVESAELFEDEIGFPGGVIYFHCPRKIAEKRFLDRKRSDDDDRGVFAKRYADFEASNQELVKRYAEVLNTIDSSGDTEVTKRLMLEMLGVPDQK